MGAGSEANAQGALGPQASSASHFSKPLRRTGRCNSKLPPAIPAVERRAFPTSLDPAIAVRPRPGATPSGSAPSVGSRPSDPDGRTRCPATERTSGLPIPAARAPKRWLGDCLLKTRRTGLSLDRRCRRSISDLGRRCYGANARFGACKGRSRRERRVQRVHAGDVFFAQMVPLSGLDVAPECSPLLLQPLLVGKERQAVLFSIVGHFLAARRPLDGSVGSVVHDRIEVVAGVCECLLIPNGPTKLFRTVDIAPQDRDVRVPIASRMFVAES